MQLPFKQPFALVNIELLGIQNMVVVCGSDMVVISNRSIKTSVPAPYIFRLFSTRVFCNISPKINVQINQYKCAI